MRRTLWLIATLFVLSALAVPQDVESFVEEGEHMRDSLAAEASSNTNQQQVSTVPVKQWLATPHRLRYAPARCVAQIKVLRAQFDDDSKARKDARNAVLKAKKKAQKLPLETFKAHHLADLGITDILTAMDAELPKDATPKKKDVLTLLGSLARSLRKHHHAQRFHIRRLVRSCARKCSARQTILKRWARRIFLLHSLSRRRLLASRKELFAAIGELKQYQTQLASIRKTVASNKDASKRALGAKMVQVAADIVTKLWKHAFALRRRVHAQFKVFRWMSHRVRKAKVLFWRVKKQCGQLLVRHVKRGVYRSQPKSVRRANALYSYLRKMRWQQARTLKAVRAEHRAAVLQQRRAMIHEKAVRAAQPKKAYIIVTHSQSSGLKVNYNPKTGEAKPIRLNPGKYPPKYKWAFHSSSTDVVPVSPAAKTAIVYSVARAARAPLAPKAAQKFISRVLKRAITVVGGNGVPSQNATAISRGVASRERSIAVARSVEQWLKRLPTVIKHLQQWYASRRKVLWSWYLRNGNMHRFSRYLRALKMVYAHRIVQIRATAQVLRHLANRILLQVRIAQVQRQIAVVGQALVRAMFERNRAQKAFLSQQLNKKNLSKHVVVVESYIPKQCPRGYLRDIVSGRCAAASSPKAIGAKGECGKNKVQIEGKCICRRGYRPSNKKNGVCVATPAKKKNAVKKLFKNAGVCRKNWYFFRGRCLKVCPEPYVAHKETRLCLSPARVSTLKNTSSLPCGKNMVKSAKNGQCKCAFGFRRARGGRFCVRYRTTFRMCRQGWFLTAGRCVRKCPSPLIADSKKRVCSVMQGLTKKETKAAVASAKAASDAREQERSLLRDKIRNLQNAHAAAKRRQELLAQKLRIARNSVLALKQQRLRDTSDVATRKKELKEARNRVSRLVVAKRRAEALLRHLQAAHKRSLARVQQLERLHKEALVRAVARVRALGRARDRVAKLADAYKRAKLATAHGNTRIAAARDALVHDEMEKARRDARRRARQLRLQRDELLKRAAAKVAALQKAEKAAEHAAARLSKQQSVDAKQIARLAQEKQQEIAVAKAQAQQLKAKAHAVLSRCIRGDQSLRQAKRALKEAAQRKAAAVKVAQARVKAQSAAEARAQALVNKTKALAAKAHKILNAKVQAAVKCQAVTCECKSDSCVERKKGLVSPASSTAASSSSAKKNNKGKRAVKRARRAIWRGFHRVSRLRRQWRRLRHLAHLARNSDKTTVLSKIREAASKIGKRINKTRRFVRRVVRRTFGNTVARKWLIKHRRAVRAVLGRNDSLTRALYNNAAPSAVSAAAKKLAAKFRALSQRKKTYIAQLKQTTDKKIRENLLKKIRIIRQAQVTLAHVLSNHH